MPYTSLAKILLYSCCHIFAHTKPGGYLDYCGMCLIFSSSICNLLVALKKGFKDLPNKDMLQQLGGQGCVLVQDKVYFGRPSC